MRLEGLEPLPTLGLSHQPLSPEAAADELARARCVAMVDWWAGCFICVEDGAAHADTRYGHRLVWEEEKPKRSLLGSLGWSGSPSKQQANRPPPPEPVQLTELYAVVRGVRRVRPRAEVLVAAAGDQVCWWGNLCIEDGGS